jgi:hypothetical protein
VADRRPDPPLIEHGADEPAEGLADRGIPHRAVPAGREEGIESAPVETSTAGVFPAACTASASARKRRAEAGISCCSGGFSPDAWPACAGRLRGSKGMAPPLIEASVTSARPSRKA